MSFLARLLAAVLEYIFAKAFALGYKQYQELEADETIKKQAETDSQALAASKDSEARVAALEKITNDTFNPSIKPN